MKFFIDTANLEQIREANALGVLDGVTTNPSLMAKEGIKGVENQHKHYIEICNIVDGDVSAEVIATNYESVPIVHWFSLPDRHYLRQRRGLPMYLRLSADWMIFAMTV